MQCIEAVHNGRRDDSTVHRISRSAMIGAGMTAAALATLDDESLIEAVQRQTFKFFWEGAHPGSGLAPDRRTTRDEPVDDLAAIGGTAVGVMALIVAAERGWVARDAEVEGANTMRSVLARATRPEEGGGWKERDTP